MIKIELSSLKYIMQITVRRDKSGRRARAGKDILSLCLSRLDPRVPIHLRCPDPPRLTVYEVIRLKSL